MDNKIIQVAENIPTILKNTHLNVSLSGWPAAVTAIAFFTSGVITYALKVTHPETTYTTEESYIANKAA